MKSIEMALVHGAIENSIMTFVADPPDTNFQLGYLSALANTLAEVGGKDYQEFVDMCASNMKQEDK